jgi:rhodanese-related sulfurtransferase
MLRILGSARRFCDGASRRDFLQIGAFGAGLTLADMLRGGTAHAAAKKQPSRSRKAAIMIYLPGGPSHMDMYDLKPDAPAEFRGEFKAIDTNVPGVQICEHMPLQAKMWDKLACVRSLVSVDEHSDTLVMTGYPDRVNRIAEHPSFGSVVSKLRGEDAGAVPPFVSLRGMSRGTEPGYLGIAHRPFTPGGQGNANLRLANGVTLDRLEDRKGLLGAFDDTRREIDATGSMAGMDAYTEKAIEMVTAGVVRDALDLKKEDPKVVERYKGVESFLTARRLVEAGVGCVTLSIGGWDTHGQNFTTLKRQLPQVDKGIANLIQDLHDRGMAEDVVTVMWGEFGRTPKVNMNAGRDHWSPVMSAMIAGGGLKMGQAVGASTAKGERPKDRPYSVPQLLSTIYRAMGIDPAQTFNNGAGRPMYILDEREPVKELLG